MIWVFRLAQLGATCLIAYCAVRNTKAAAPLATDEQSTKED